ncbi:glycosyltransferase [Myceligenerans pegani]|uniref:Glycosyltransferase family 1 protein n=1 Tax=Myceligenerans pegani TaxID=2776917 RepID=A0ABR9N2V3_9MICO|nr:glycosyltransferase [Myceligenerans sp. TRM 65318]MBE1877342.1 glycosyltransferase family 1 protein [Myceligenerans sp. TRM 65318]MBE3019613.1 glycosyltransferase family 1 protein [Myceligenerans sp. TRM 65318]
MRVLLTTYGSRGDVEPMAGLALALQELGAEVRVCAPPDFAELLDAAGVRPLPVGRPIRALATGLLADEAPKTLPEITAELAGMAYEAVTTAGEFDAVVSAGVIGMQAGVQAAAEKRGIPYTGASFSTNFVPSPHHPPVPWPGQSVPEGETDNRVLWDLNAEHLQGLFGPPINTLRASWGLEPSDNVRDLILGDHPLLASDPVLGPWRPATDLDVTQTGAWIRPDERPLPAGLEAFLEAGAPPVYVGFGSMPLHDAEQTGRAAFEAVRGHGRRIVLGSGWAELVPDGGSDDCHVVGEINQQALFRRVAAVVHHGGAGTTTTAARAGAPQVIVPQVADQPYWGGRVAALGIGAVHDGAVPTTASLSAALVTALSPEACTRAAAVAGTIRADGARTAAKLVLRGAG